MTRSSMQRYCQSVPANAPRNLFDVTGLTEEEARALLEELRWPDGVVCPHCAHKGKIYRLKGAKCRAGLMKCSKCRKQFTVTTKTAMHATHLSCRKWVAAFYLMASHKKGISARQLHRDLGIGSFRSAWYLAHRIREAMRPSAWDPPLQGDVEMDEAFMGGKPRIPQYKTRSGAKRGAGTDRPMVAAALERGGRVRARHVERRDMGSLMEFADREIDEEARIYTDELSSYNEMGNVYRSHDIVLHKIKEYARYELGRKITTNEVESFFGLFKRKLHGTHHSMSRKHLDRYLIEASFLWNTRHWSDGQRMAEAVLGGNYRRLTYKDLVTIGWPRFQRW